MQGVREINPQVAVLPDRRTQTCPYTRTHAHTTTFFNLGLKHSEMQTTSVLTFTRQPGRIKGEAGMSLRRQARNGLLGKGMRSCSKNRLGKGEAEMWKDC